MMTTDAMGGTSVATGAVDGEQFMKGSGMMIKVMFWCGECGVNDVSEMRQISMKDES